MKKRFTIILLVIGVGLSAQTKVDSLFAVWQDQAQPKASRVDAYKDYIWDGFMFSNPDSAGARFGLSLPLSWIGKGTA